MVKLKNVAMIVAAGSSSRFGGEKKQYLKILDKTILRITIDKFLGSNIDAIKVVIAKEDIDLYKNTIKGLDILDYSVGGNSRAQSVQNGINDLVLYDIENILIHDAARPNITTEFINDIISNIENKEVVLPALKVVDSVKKKTDIVKTVDRNNLYLAQTPQAFKFELLKSKEIERLNFADESEIFEGDHKIQIINGEEDNFKITYSNDFDRFKKIYLKDMSDHRIGIGYDVHKFSEITKGAHVILGGVKIEHDKYLIGHSDADVLTHSIVDALLGSLALGDIGEHFPDNDISLKGIDSLILLNKAYNLVLEKGYKIVNIDTVIICEKPKLLAHRNNIRDSLSEVLNLDRDFISIKATTTEGLGFEGKKEGIAVKSVIMVKRDV